MRTYGQYCALARALDVLGDRWTLLIVRELLLRGPSRYTDLREGLPGIATNLLADRLRELEAAGVVARTEAPPPVASTLITLTERGAELEDAVLALGRWGIPLMADGPAPGDTFRERWMKLPVELFLRDRQPEEPPVQIEVRTGERPMVIETIDGEVRVRAGAADDAAAVLGGPPQLVLGVLSGQLALEAAEAAGLSCEGDRGSLRRLLSEPASA